MKLTAPIIAATIVSLAIHAVVMVSSSPTKIALPSSKGSVISVKIKEIKHAIPKPAKKPLAQKIIKKTPKPIVKKETQPKLATKVVKEEITKENSAERLKQQNQFLAQVKSTLVKKLKTNFIYPRLAQRKNWQGKVILSLHLSSSGKIENIQLSSSSGHDILDTAAITALQKIERLHNISLWFNNGVTMQLPVIYKLTES